MAIERERWDMGEGEIRSQERGTERGAQREGGGTSTKRGDELARGTHA